MVSLKNNVGVVDRVIRLCISAALVYLALFYPPAAENTLTSNVLLVTGVINAIVAVVGVCPVYLMIGVRTNKS